MTFEQSVEQARRLAAAAAVHEIAADQALAKAAVGEGCTAEALIAARNGLRTLAQVGESLTRSLEDRLWAERAAATEREIERRLNEALAERAGP